MMSNFLSVMWERKKKKTENKKKFLKKKKCLSNDATHATFILKSVRVFLAIHFHSLLEFRLNVLLYQIDKK